jgi:signal transduction histidine kinase
MPNDSDSLSELSPQQAFWELEKTILNSLEYNEVIQNVVDSILTKLNYFEIGYKVVVLVLYDEKDKVLKRIALSQTKEAQKTKEVSAVKFEDIHTPITATQNLCVRAMLDGKIYSTSYFPDILTPPLTPENALESQKNAGIKASMIYPLMVNNNPLGVLLFSITKELSEVSNDEKSLLQHFTDIVALAVKNAQLYSNIQKQKLELVETNQNLIKLNRIKDDFISVATHELKTPMSIIKNNLWMLQNNKEIILDDKQKVYIDRSLEATERMMRLVSNILNISAIENGKNIEIKKINIELCPLIQTILDEFKDMASKKNLALKFNSCETHISTYADPEKIREIVTNLLSNAIKYTEKGEVSIDIKDVSDDEVKVIISDTGRGISKENMAKLFHKFERIESSLQGVAEAGGTGLGLYIVKLLVEAMGGQVGAESKGLDQGSVFWFILPIKEKNIKVASILN